MESEPLSTKQRERIIKAVGLELQPGLEPAVAEALCEAARVAWIQGLWQRTRLQPARDARFVRGLTSEIDALLERLEERPGLADGRLIAWAGYDAELDTSDEEDASRGLARADQAVEDIRRAKESLRWLQDRLAGWERRTREAAGSAGRPSVTESRLQVLSVLAPAFERGFGRELMATRAGSGVKFLRAFFEECGDPIEDETALKLIRSSRAAG